MSDEFSGLIPVTDHELFQATTARGFEPGHELFGRFVLIRVLGRGGMGIVWLARDRQLDQDVAIKVLPDVVMHDREAVTDMKRETKRSLQLNHHNIVRIYDFNQDERGAGISMEFVDGETLSAAKAERPSGCFDVEEVGPWLEQICEALAYAHNTARIVHRDLKPANIMLSKDNTIKVSDFGIARSISDSISRVSMRHASSGTMVYMSPQQSAGGRSSSSDDIYALGATVYDLLTGKPPFFSGNIQHQLESITPPSMAERRIELDRQGTPIPEAWEFAIAACLEKEPSKRPTSVHDLAQRLNLRIMTPMMIPAAAPAPVTVAPPVTESPLIESRVEQTPPAAANPAPPAATVLSVPGWLTPGRMKLAGIGAGCLALVAVVIGSVVLLGPGHGSVMINTVPPGASISIHGTSMSSPATFDRVASGDVTAVIALPGYESVELPAHVTKNHLTDLGMTTLTRSTGTLQVTAIPKKANCTLKLVQSAVTGEQPDTIATFPAATPWKSQPLPTGKYELVAAAAGLPDATISMEINRGDRVQKAVDLVKESAIHALSPEEISAVNSDQPLPDKLRQDSAAKDQLTAYYRKTFQDYLKNDQFDLAANQLKRLSGDLSAATTDEQKQLDEEQLIVQKGQGTLSVKTVPAGAAVTVDGKTLTSPAIFDKLVAGTRTVDIKLDGYSPVQVPAQVTRDNLTDLGETTLTRSAGAVAITAIPPNAACEVDLVESPVKDESPGVIANFTGPDGWKLPQLITGKYSVSATVDGLPSATRNFEVKAGDNLTFSIDLVRENALHLLSADQVSVVENDQPIPDKMKQDAAAKAALISYYQQTFQGYLQLKDFKLAAGQLHHLSDDLGAGSATDQQQLDQLQADWLTSEKTNLNQLIQQERFTEADALLSDMETHGPQPELRATFNQAKTDHEAAVAKALDDIDELEKAGNEPGAYQAAVAAANQDKLEPRLALRVANLELPMPSTYERVSKRVKALAALLAAAPALGKDADFARLQGIFQKNLDSHTSFRKEISEVEDSGHYASQIAALRADEKHNQDKANGYVVLNLFGIGGQAAGAVKNSDAASITGNAASAIGSDGAAARQADIQRDQDRIAELQSDEEAKEDKLRDLRQQYEAFQQNPINAIQ